MHDESAPFVVQSTQCNQLFNCVNVLPFARPALQLVPDEAASLICVFEIASTAPSGDVNGAVSFRSIQDSLLLAISIADDDDAATTDAGDEIVSIALVGRYCESRLSVDVNDFISFDDCVVGSVYVRDITLRNLAEIELVYSLLLSGPNADCVAFEDYDTGTIKSLGSLAGHASETLRVVFRPRAAGSFTVQVVVQNDNDPSQRASFELMADVSTTRQQRAALRADAARLWRLLHHVRAPRAAQALQHERQATRHRAGRRRTARGRVRHTLSPLPPAAPRRES
jgi:hypothetical protein